MPRRMSCFFTTEQVRQRIKTETRRAPNTWVNLKSGDRLTLIEKGMGLKKGEKQVVLAEARCVSNTLEILFNISQESVAREGFPQWTPMEFIQFYLNEKGGDVGQPVRVIRWEYVDEVASVRQPVSELTNRVHCMDAIELMRLLPAQSVDAIISDPPYNMTELDFDQQPVNWSEFWTEARRILKSKNSPVVLFSQQPFTTDLIMSNRMGWRYELIWEKTMPVGFLDANRRPLRCHENIQIFGDSLPDYFPQMEASTENRSRTPQGAKEADHYNKHDEGHGGWIDNGTRYPRSVWKFAQRHNAFSNTKTLHPTEKPLPLMERLVLTYTEPGWLILDPFCGSGSTGAAAQNNGRRWIMSDNSAEHVEVAEQRLSQPYTVNMFDRTVTAEIVSEVKS